MAMGVETRGRPYYVATIPFKNQRRVAFLEEFYKVTSTLNYQEVMALSRAFRVHSSTVWNWKYKVTFPRWHIAIDIIDWYQQGKPLHLMYQRDKRPTMM